MTKHFLFWQKWLLTISGVFVVVGLMLSILGGTPMLKPVLDGLLQVSPTFWAASEVTPAIRGFQQFSYGVMGAELAGWGVFMFFIVSNGFARREKWAWQCLAAAFSVWFIPDTAMSLYAGVVFNALSNFATLVAVALPLAFTHTAFK